MQRVDCYPGQKPFLLSDTCLAPNRPNVFPKRIIARILYKKLLLATAENYSRISILKIRKGRISQIIDTLIIPAQKQ
jgi:hypothetical protein